MSEYNDDEWDYVSPPSPTIKGVWMAQEVYDAQAAQVERLKGLVRDAIPLTEGVAFGVCLDSSDWHERAKQEFDDVR